VTSIFVGNLDFGPTEPSIRSLFETHGNAARSPVMAGSFSSRWWASALATTG